MSTTLDPRPASARAVLDGPVAEARPRPAPSLPGMPPARPITSYKPYWAKRFGPAPFLPMSRAEMEALGWDSCDIVIVTGDAYVDHPSFGMAVIGRTLEAWPPATWTR